jgi:arylsulfatase A-like enzyme
MNESGIRRALVVSFDRLHAGFIGCFGNDWIETPHFDRLATEAVVFDQHFCENLDPIAANHAWWTGRRQFPLDAKQQRECRSFVDQLHAWGVSTCLIVESDGGDDSTLAPPFGEVFTERGIDGFDAAEADTPFARLVQRCRLWLSDSARQPGAALLWIKSRGVPSPWVPPQSFGELYLDEFGLGADVAEETEAGPEPTGSDSAIGSSDERVFGSGADGSIDWRYAAAMYAAYVTLIDRGLGRLLTAVRETPGWEQALLIVTAAAGQPLGEHAAIGAEMIPLRAESLHAPLWIQARGFDQAGTRRQALVQTTDVAPTLLDWFRGAAPGDMPEGRTESDVAGRSLLPLVWNQDVSLPERLVMGHGRAEWAIRTPDFFYAEPGDRWTEAEDSKAVLFEKPHDRWDQCDVLAQYPQVAEELRARLRREIPGLQDASGESED